MNEWSLPAGPAGEYASFVAAEKSAGRYDARKGFLRGGIWRNFMSRYPEANWMHKRMLALSARLAALPPGPPRDELRPLLHLAQANDAYWHGLFGGLYLPHLRRGVWRHLLLLEAGLDRVSPRPRAERLDLDHDGVDDVFFSNDEAQIAVRMDGSASVAEIDGYRLAQNFGDTLRRHPEHYHAKARNGAESAHGAGEGIASAHDRVAFKHAIAPDELVPDATPRHAFRDRWHGAGGDAEVLSSYAETRVEGTAVEFEALVGATRIGKSIALDGATVTVRYRVRDGAGGRLSTTLDLAMPSCDGVAGRYLVGGSIPGGFGQPLDLERASELVLDDRHMRRQRRAAPRSAGAYRRAALPHGVAVGGRLRARDAVGDAGDRVDRRGRCRGARGASHDPQRSAIVPGGAGGDEPSAHGDGAGHCVPPGCGAYFFVPVALATLASSLFAPLLLTVPRMRMSGGVTGLPKKARFHSSDRFTSVPLRFTPP